MALSAGSGFSKLARMDSQIQQVLATFVHEPTPKHQPFISKKKEARREREAKERELALLRSTPLDELVFTLAESNQPTSAAKEQSKFDELEQQMRIAFGLDTVTPPAPVAPKPKAAVKPLVAKPSVPVPAKTRVEFSMIKRHIEVLLRIRRPDGLELPFFHVESHGSQFEAELSAGRKARGYGFTVLSTIQITVKEEVCEHRS